MSPRPFVYNYRLTPLPINAIEPYEYDLLGIDSLFCLLSQIVCERLSLGLSQRRKKRSQPKKADKKTDRSWEEKLETRGTRSREKMKSENFTVFYTETNDETCV